MNKGRLDSINRKLDKIRVTSFKEDVYKINSNFLSLKKGEYFLNNGKTIFRDTIIKTCGVGNACVIVPITKDNKIVIVMQVRASLPDNDKVSIELPAGYIEEGESPIDSSKRELEEETGYKSDNLVLVDSYFPSLGASGEKIDLVMAFNCEATGSINLDSSEYIECEEVSLDEFKYLIDNGYIKNANSRIAYYKLLEYFKSK